MASSLPPVKGAAFSFETALVSTADTDIFKAGPTLAAGDVKVIKDGTYDDNIDSLPTAVTSATNVITVALSATEMNADRVTVIFHDASGDEWQDQVVTIFTAAQTLDTTDGIADDIKAVVAHTDYGNAKLVRSTTPANTLTVDASHQALSLTNAVTNDAITAAAIANGAIDAATFAAGAIDAAAIADNAIDAGAIADGAIDNGALAADAISAAKIAADVTTELQSGLATATAALILATPANKLTTDASGRVEVSGTKNTLDSLADFDPATDVVAHVTLVDTTTTNSDMVAVAPSAADIKTALEADGSKLDHLWEMTEDDGGVRRLTANALEEGPVGTGTSTLSAQDVRDAMKLAPTAGDPEAGSVDKHLDDILEDTGTTLDTLIKDIPTNAEFEARTLPSADYTVVSDLGTVQSGDAYARLGAPAGASVSADIADLPTVTEFEARTIAAADYTIVSDLPTAPSAADNATAAAAAILVTPANKLDTDASGHVSISGTKNTLDSLNDITVADIIAGITEGTLDLQEILRIILAAVAGKASGGGTATIKFRDQADTKDRITATVDANGNRTAVTVDGS